LRGEPKIKIPEEVWKRGPIFEQLERFIERRVALVLRGGNVGLRRLPENGLVFALLLEGHVSTAQDNGMSRSPERAK